MTCTRNGRMILTSRPNDKIVEKFLGTSPSAGSPRLFRRLADQLRHGRPQSGCGFSRRKSTAPKTTSSTSPAQSNAFLTALTQSGYFVRRLIIPAFRHF